jgi:uncharacterized protein (TIGR02145 family)
MKRVSIVLSLLLFSYCESFAQKEEIKTVKIGNQVWMAKNLDVSTFRNGDPIKEAKTKEDWFKARNKKTAAFCYYDYDSKNGKIYGKLYNWYAVNDPRGLAPKGWHIPSDEEWTILTNYLGGENYAGTKLKSKTGWDYNGNGDDSYGFLGLPGGSCNGNCNYFLESAAWWTSSEDMNDFAWRRSVISNNTRFIRSSDVKESGLSVRCIKD